MFRTNPNHLLCLWVSAASQFVFEKLILVNNFLTANSLTAKFVGGNVSLSMFKSTIYDIFLSGMYLSLHLNTLRLEKKNENWYFCFSRKWLFRKQLAVHKSCPFSERPLPTYPSLVPSPWSTYLGRFETITGHQFIPTLHPHPSPTTRPHPHPTPSHPISTHPIPSHPPAPTTKSWPWDHVLCRRFT